MRDVGVGEEELAADVGAVDVRAAHERHAPRVVRVVLLVDHRDVAGSHHAGITDKKFFSIV